MVFQVLIDIEYWKSIWYEHEDEQKATTVMCFKHLSMYHLFHSNDLQVKYEGGSPRHWFPGHHRPCPLSVRGTAGHSLAQRHLRHSWQYKADFGGRGRVCKYRKMLRFVKCFKNDCFITKWISSIYERFCLFLNHILLLLFTLAVEDFNHNDNDLKNTLIVNC